MPIDKTHIDTPSGFESLTIQIYNFVHKSNLNESGLETSDRCNILRYRVDVFRERLQP